MTTPTIAREFRELPLGVIDEPVLPSRSAMDEEKLDELTRSVQAIGLQQPIVVGRRGERYEVIAGHRRTLACKRAGLVAVPCIVYPSVEAASEAIKFAENAFREDLNAADEAIWFTELLERDCGGDVDRLAAQLHLSRARVESRLLLFAGDELVFQALRDDKIRIGVAQQLNRCSDQQYRRYLLDAAIRGGATVSVVAGWIADWQRSSGAALASTSDAPAAAAPAPVPETNYFTCYVCRKSDNVHLMQPINVHQHCRLALLEPALALAQAGNTIPYPRTTHEARALAEKLLDDFPELTGPADPRPI